MPSPYRGPILARLHAVLDDGQWHEFELVMKELMKAIPPGPAIREAERNRRNSGSLSARRLRDAEDPQRLVDIGRRQIVQAVLRYAPVEIVPPGLPGRRRVKVERKIRLREGA